MKIRKKCNKEHKNKSRKIKKTLLRKIDKKKERKTHLTINKTKQT